MATPYCDVEDLRSYLAGDGTNASAAGRLLTCINGAASMVDEYTRRPPRGAQAFTSTAEDVTRYYNDDQSGVIRIDDCLEIATLTRAGGEIEAANYYTYPYNELPITEIHLTTLAVTPLIAVGGVGYHYPYKGIGVHQIAVTGTWGFCTDGTRPYQVKEATLILAALLYRKPGIPLAEMLQAMRSPVNDDLKLVKSLLDPLRIYGREAQFI